MHTTPPSPPPAPPQMAPCCDDGGWHGPPLSPHPHFLLVLCLPAVLLPPGSELGGGISGEAGSLVGWCRLLWGSRCVQQTLAGHFHGFLESSPGGAFQLQLFSWPCPIHPQFLAQTHAYLPVLLTVSCSWSPLFWEPLPEQNSYNLIPRSEVTSQTQPSTLLPALTFSGMSRSQSF